MQNHSTCTDIILNLFYIMLLLFYFNEIEAYRNDKLEPQPSNYDHHHHKRLVTSPQKYKCLAIGKFVDSSNHHSYWNCDAAPDGGYIATHKLCPSGLVFSTQVRGCIMKKKRSDSPCEDKSEGKVSYIVVVTQEPTYPDTTECPSTTPSTSCSSCPTKPPCLKGIKTPKPDCFKCTAEGVFADPKSCTSFYICHRKKGAKNCFEKIKVNCPDGMAFDSKAGWCSQHAKRAADSKNVAEKGKT